MVGRTGRSSFTLGNPLAAAHVALAIGWRRS